MKQKILGTLIIIGLGFMAVSCGQAEFTTSSSILDKLDSESVSEQEVIEAEPNNEQVQEVEDAISEVMDPEVKEPIEEVVAPEEPNTIDRVKMYLCKEEPPKKKIVKKVHHCCYIKDSAGNHVVDSRGDWIRSGSCGTHTYEAISEEPIVSIPKYMVCHAAKGSQSKGTSLCLPRADIEAYIKKARGSGGTSYMGPCKN